MDPKRTETEPKWTEIEFLGVGLAGGLSGWGGGVVKEQESLQGPCQKGGVFRSVAERKFLEFFEFSSRISLRIFPEFFEDFSCFISRETKTTKNLPQIPAIFYAKSAGKFEAKNPQKLSGEPAR